MERLEISDGLRFGLGWFGALVLLMLMISLLGLIIGVKNGK